MTQKNYTNVIIPYSKILILNELILANSLEVPLKKRIRKPNPKEKTRMMQEENFV